tara:strand:- start:23 stop:682 length:660 start_codon:yes stop_codon:yes gene_type:complete
MDFPEIAEEAWERAGREMRSGYDLRTARRSMNLLTIEWANRGINLWTIREDVVDLVKGDVDYTLNNSAIDIIEQNIRTNDGVQAQQNDLPITRVSVSTYSGIPNKLTQGRPTQVWIDRQRSAPVAHVWPVPDKNDTYKLKYFYLKRIEDAGEGAYDADMPFRFLPCLVAGLAYYIAMKTPELSDRIPLLKNIYDEQFSLAAGEDRDKTSARFVPRIGYP